MKVNRLLYCLLLSVQDRQPAVYFEIVFLEILPSTGFPRAGHILWVIFLTRGKLF